MVGSRSAAAPGLFPPRQRRMDQGQSHARRPLVLGRRYPVGAGEPKLHPQFTDVAAGEPGGQRAAPVGRLLRQRYGREGHRRGRMFAPADGVRPHHRDREFAGAAGGICAVAADRRRGASAVERDAGLQGQHPGHRPGAARRPWPAEPRLLPEERADFSPPHAANMCGISPACSSCWATRRRRPNGSPKPCSPWRCGWREVRCRRWTSAIRSRSIIR